VNKRTQLYNTQLYLKQKALGQLILNKENGLARLEIKFCTGELQTALRIFSGTWDCHKLIHMLQNTRTLLIATFLDHQISWVSDSERGVQNQITSLAGIRRVVLIWLISINQSIRHWRPSPKQVSNVLLNTFHCTGIFDTKFYFVKIIIKQAHIDEHNKCRA